MNIDTVIQGDCREILKTLPDASVNCCVTSPPYYGLRDYGMDEQIGLEQTAEEFITTGRPKWCPLTEVVPYGPEGTFYKEK